MDWHNKKHYHSGLNFVTSTSIHSGQAEKIVLKRKKVYIAAKLLHPLRFERVIRNFDLSENVSLNPGKEKLMENIS